MGRLIAALSLVAALGCGGPTGRPPAASADAPPAVPPLESFGPAASRYATASTPDPVQGAGPSAAATAAGVARAAAAADVALEGDGRLAALAEAVARAVAEDGTPPPHALLEALSRRAGLVEPAPHLLVIGGPTGAPSLADRVAEAVGDLLPRQLYNRFGAAVVARGGREVVVVCLSSRWLRLEPIPLEVAPGTALTLRGALEGPFERPTVVVQSPDGRVRRLPAGAARRILADLALEAPGLHRVEVLGQGPRGDTVIANFPLFVGVDPDGALRDAVAEGLVPAPADTDPRVVAARLRALLAEAREAAGLPALEEDPRLVAIARAHGEDMVATGFVGHTSPTTGTAADRVEAAGVRSGLVLENIGRGYGAQEIHRGLLESPGHRANLLHPDVTHFGIGVVAEPEGSRSAFVATQVFVRRLPRLNLAEAPAQVVARVADLRSAESLGEVRSDPRLAAAAQRAAERFFAEPGVGERAVVEDATRDRAFGRRYRRVGGVLVLVEKLEDVATLEPFRDRDLDALGVGVAQGTRPDTAPNAVAVVVLLGWRR